MQAQERAAERPARPLGEAASQPRVNGQQVGHVLSGPHSRKRRRKGAEGPGREDSLPLGPGRRSGCSPAHCDEPETRAESPRRRKRKKRQKEVEERERSAAQRSTRPSDSAGPGLSPPPPLVNGQLPGDQEGLGQAPLVCRNREQKSDVVQELLRYSSDKAYGKKVLTWDGEVSAVSRDAAEDSRLARTQSVVDDWDEEFDRGKEKKVKKFKREKRNFNAFQKLQSRRNFWAATHPAKATSLSYRR